MIYQIWVYERTENLNNRWIISWFEAGNFDDAMHKFLSLYDVEGDVEKSGKIATIKEGVDINELGNIYGSCGYQIEETEYKTLQQAQEGVYWH